MLFNHKSFTALALLILFGTASTNGQTPQKKMVKAYGDFDLRSTPPSVLNAITTELLKLPEGKELREKMYTNSDFYNPTGKFLQEFTNENKKFLARLENDSLPDAKVLR